MPSATISEERCAGCGRCVAACRLRIITLETSAHRSKKAVITNPAICNACGACVTSCLLGAICLKALPRDCQQK